MTWTLVIALAAGSYLFKVLGLVIVGDRALPPVLDRCLALIPAALIAALIANDTFGIQRGIRLDARAVGVLGAVIAAWRKRSMIAVIVVAAVLTAATRRFTS
jgi:branched-subunit amino acid transport protein